MNVKRAIALAIPLAALAGCSTNLSPEPSRVPVTRAPPPVRSIVVSPAQYVTAAASASLFVIRASDLVVARERGSALGQFARRLKTEHGGIGAQLSFAGRRLDLLPTATLLSRHQELIDDITASADPGKTYAHHLRTVLPQAAMLHRDYYRYGTSATLRPVASMAAPLIAQEIDALRRL